MMLQLKLLGLLGLLQDVEEGPMVDQSPAALQTVPLLFQTLFLLSMLLEWSQGQGFFGEWGSTVEFQEIVTRWTWWYVSGSVFIMLSCSLDMSI